MCYNPEQYEGPYCQYDRTQCQRYGGFLCNGTEKKKIIAFYIHYTAGGELEMEADADLSLNKYNITILILILQSKN